MFMKFNVCLKVNIYMLQREIHLLDIFYFFILYLFKSELTQNKDQIILK